MKDLTKLEREALILCLRFYMGEANGNDLYEAPSEQELFKQVEHLLPFPLMPHSVYTRDPQLRVEYDKHLNDIALLIVELVSLRDKD